MQVRAPGSTWILTFPTTHAAISLERSARTAGLRGRLIPTPRSLSASCGMAWAAPPETADALLAFAAQKSIPITQSCCLPIHVPMGGI